MSKHDDVPENDPRARVERRNWRYKKHHRRCHSSTASESNRWKVQSNSRKRLKRNWIKKNADLGVSPIGDTPPKGTFAEDY